MELLKTLLITLFTLGVVVSIHEFGHFWVARRCGVRVLRFSVGFGRALWRRVGRDGTEYVVAAIPLGGYVKMLDEREGGVPQQDIHRAFNRQPVLARMAIVAAGPAANLLLAVVVFYALYMAGVRGVAPVVGEIEPGSPAALAGLHPGDELVSVDGKPTPTRQAVSMQLLKRIGESGEIRLGIVGAGDEPQRQVLLPIREWLSDQEELDPFASLGLAFEQPVIEPLISEVGSGSAAEAAGLLSGDRIVSVDGSPVSTWDDWVRVVRASPGADLSLEVARGGEQLSLVLVPSRVERPDGQIIGQAGVSAVIPDWPEEYLRSERYGPVAAWRPALGQTWSLVVFTVDSTVKMVEGLISPKNLSGPITIAKVAAASARSGVESYIGFLALLSISLGVLNLLPIPVLDGGHLLFCLAELVKGSPVSERVQMLGYQVGLLILVSVMALALFNDISRFAAN
jgi:regulator of sigma E protease